MTGGIAAMSEAREQPRTFEESLLELERMVRELEDGRLGLDEALARYEQGVSLIQQCHKQLRDAEQRVQQLTGCDESGQPVLQAFRHEATAAARDPARRLRKAPEPPA
jgi:exodeoxyribonuclease VII small subunit